MTWVVADAANYGVPLGTLIIAVATFAWTVWYSARKVARAADESRVTSLEKTIAELDTRVSECEADRSKLHAQLEAARDREFRLMQRILRLEEKTK